MIDLRRRLRDLREQQEQAVAGRRHRPVEREQRIEPDPAGQRAADPVTPYDELWFEGRPIDA